MDERKTPSVLFITGANRGLGLEFVRQYAQEGWHVFATCRNPRNAHDLQEIAVNYPLILIEQLDVCDPKQIAQLAAKLASKKIDLLINNAGIIGQRPDTLGCLSRENFEKLYQTNAMAPLFLIEAFRQHIARSDQKLIVSMSSKVASIGEDPTLDLVSYRMSKVALNMGMQEMATKLKSEGIHLLLMTPGWVKTEMGGPHAKIEAAESVFKMRQVIACARNLRSGGFYDREGKEIGW